MSSCCEPPPAQNEPDSSCCGPETATAKRRPDYLLWGSLSIVVFLYLHHVLVLAGWLGPLQGYPGWYQIMVHAVHELINTMWWGVVLGILMLALLSRVPREFVISILGSRSGSRLNAILRATAAGVLLDLCSHGILMVGTKLYERGATVGQLMAFLIASPWNSFSLTLILIALIGLPLTIAFILLSMVIAIITGLLFDLLVDRGVLAANPQQVDLPDGFHFWQAARSGLAGTRYTPAFLAETLWMGIRESRMVLRWLMFGVVLASALRAFMDPAMFSEYFGPTTLGLALTMLAATVIEVCSEGSTPLAADLVTRANAPGNGFAFLMTGVATDYTEIMVIRESTRSFKTALFLPLLSVPQVLVVAWLMNSGLS
ncbi:MAG TPA: ATPase [Gammaproteobacteria bacterium]|nr:ATPase [Gammaproteobacteria bacterium]